MLKLDPDNLMGNYYYAKILAEMGRSDQARIYLEKVLVLRPGFEPALLDLAALFERAGQLQDAIGIYREMRVASPARTALNLKIADLLIKSGKSAEAEKELVDVLANEPDHRQARTALGLLFYDENRFSEAASEFTILLANEPTDDRIRYLLANALEKQGDEIRALSHYRRVSPSFELYANARVAAAMLLKKAGNLDEAVTLMNETLREKTNQPITYLYLSSLHEDLKDLPAAEKVLSDGLTRFPDDTDLLYALGMIYEKDGRFEEGIRMMEAILKKDADHADALNFIGYTYADRGIHLDEAEALILRALALKPDNGYILDSLGWVHFKQKRMNSALKHLKRAIELLPGDANVMEHLGDVYLAIGRKREAFDYYRKALEADPDNEKIQKKIKDLNFNK